MNDVQQIYLVRKSLQLKLFVFVFTFKTRKKILRKRYRQLIKKNLLHRYIKFLPTHTFHPLP